MKWTDAEGHELRLTVIDDSDGNVRDATPEQALAALRANPGAREAVERGLIPTIARSWTEFSGHLTAWRRWAGEVLGEILVEDDEARARLGGRLGSRQAETLAALQSFKSAVAYELGAERDPDRALDALKARLKELVAWVTWAKRVVPEGVIDAEERRRAIVSALEAGAYAGKWCEQGRAALRLFLRNENVNAVEPAVLTSRVEELLRFRSEVTLELCCAPEFAVALIKANREALAKVDACFRAHQIEGDGDVCETLERLSNAATSRTRELDEARHAKPLVDAALDLRSRLGPFPDLNTAKFDAAARAWHFRGVHESVEDLSPDDLKRIDRARERVMEFAKTHEPASRPGSADDVLEQTSVALRDQIEFRVAAEQELAAVKLALQASDDDMVGGSVADVVARVVRERDEARAALADIITNGDASTDRMRSYITQATGTPAEQQVGFEGTVLALCTEFKRVKVDAEKWRLAWEGLRSAADEQLTALRDDQRATGDVLAEILGVERCAEGNVCHANDVALRLEKDEAVVEASKRWRECELAAVRAIRSSSWSLARQEEIHALSRLRDVLDRQKTKEWAVNKLAAAASKAPKPGSADDVLEHMSTALRDEGSFRVRAEQQRDALWALLDDIDTLDDACREDEDGFRESVRGP